MKSTFGTCKDSSPKCFDACMIPPSLFKTPSVFSVIFRCLITVILVVSFVSAATLSSWAADADGQSTGTPIVTSVTIATKGDVKEIVDKAGELQLIATITYVNDVTGDITTEQGNADTITWAINREDRATVSTNGLVQAITNGDVRVAATVAGTNVAATFKISILNQVDDDPADSDDSGSNDNTNVDDGTAETYITDIVITDKNGDPFDVDGTSIETSGSSMQLGATVTWSDGTVRSTLNDESLDVAWDVSSESVSTISEDGLLTAVGDGTVRVNAVVVGGKEGAIVKERLYVSVKNQGTIVYDDNGTSGYPANALTIKVVYESNPDTIVKEVELSVADIEALGTEEHSYTFIRSVSDTNSSDVSFATDSARGVTLEKIMEAAGIALDDAKMFTFAAGDAATIPLSYSYLYGVSRYYYPHFANGGDTTGAIEAPAMLALQDCWAEDDDEEQFDGLSGIRRLRLVFGANGLSSGTSSKALKWVYSVTVTLEGSPPANFNDDDDDNDESGTGTGTDLGSGSGVGAGSGAGTSASSGADGDSGSDYSDGSAGIKSLSLGSDTESDETASDSTTDGGDSGDSSGSSSWRVYEINPADDLLVASQNNPLELYTILLVVIVFVTGGLTTVTEYRREI